MKSLPCPPRDLLDMGWWEPILRALGKDPSHYRVQCRGEHGYDVRGDGPNLL